MTHINNKGEFQSDRNKDLKPDRIVLSFNDQAARLALYTYIKFAKDRKLARDIKRRLEDY